MSTTVATLVRTQTQRSARHSAKIYFKEAKFEFLKNLRLRVYTLSVISFPLMFYVLFGLLLNSKESIGAVRVPTYLLATYGTFGVMGASLFGTASGLAADRGLGWLQVKRASPMPPFAYFAAKVILSFIFSAIVISLLFVLGVSFGGCECLWEKWLRCWARWSRGHCRSRRWGWRSATLPARTPHRPSSTCFICRCRSAAAYGCRTCFCPSWSARLRWRCPRTICRNWRWGLLARAATNPLRLTGRFCWLLH